MAMLLKGMAHCKCRAVTAAGLNMDKNRALDLSDNARITQLYFMAMRSKSVVPLDLVIAPFGKLQCRSNA